MRVGSTVAAAVLAFGLSACSDEAEVGEGVGEGAVEREVDE